MKFLAVIIGLLLRQFWGSGHRLHEDAWFRAWQTQVLRWNIGGAGLLLAALLPPLVAAQLMLDAVQPVLFGLLWIVLAVIVLLYSLGRGDFAQLTARYRRQCRAGDFESAYLDTLAERGGAVTVDNPQTPQEIHAWIQRDFFYESYQRWFPVLFYFVVFGPVGALGYRLLQLCRNRFEAALVERCLVIADWVPARLLAATFTLAGNFAGSKEVLISRVTDAAAAPEQILFAVGTAALDSSHLANADTQPLGDAPLGDAPLGDAHPFGELAARQNEEAGKLLSRSAICWVALLALIVLLD